MLVDDQLLAEWRAVLELHEASCETQAGRAHAVRHHEDQVPLAARRRAAVLGVLRLLVEDSEEDDKRGCNNGPHEEANFPPERPRSPAIAATLRRAAGQEGVFFGDAVVGDLRRVAAGEQGPVAGHGGYKEMASSIEGFGVDQGPGAKCEGLEK